MRKIITLTLAVLLVGSMALASFAEFHPSVDGKCGHKVNTLKINGKEVDLNKYKEAMLLVTAEDAAEVNADLDPSDPHQMTATGLTYDENAALIRMSDVARSLLTVPGYISAHKILQEDAAHPLDIAKETLDMTEEELDEFDFVHFFILKANMDMLKEAAGLGEDEEINSVVLTYDCGHMTDSTIMVHQETQLPEGTYDNVEIIDGNTVIYANAVDFGVGEAVTGLYTITLDLTSVLLTDHSLFTIFAKEATK